MYNIFTVIGVIVAALAVLAFASLRRCRKLVRADRRWPDSADQP